MTPALDWHEGTTAVDRTVTLYNIINDLQNQLDATVLERDEARSRLATLGLFVRGAFAELGHAADRLTTDLPAPDTTTTSTRETG